MLENISFILFLKILTKNIAVASFPLLSLFHLVSPRWCFI
ncbi:unnamed protein product [Tenebrio molitor]|nr:unnamed protein product [Tenebrio molitor]